MGQKQKPSEEPFSLEETRNRFKARYAAHAQSGTRAALL
jgi:hypothetical protein